jgi:3-hydroxypropionyl-coenzyme A dehydratase
MQCIQVSKQNGVGILMLNRPEVYNAINFQLMDEMEETLKAWRFDQEVRVLMITGAGDRAFASGGDVREFHSLHNKEEALTMLQRMGGILDLIESFGKPTIAAINGYALGGGCELAISCDIRLASDRAKLGLIQVKLGITTGWGGGTRLMNLMPRSQALHWMLTGEHFTAEEASDAGLIQKVFSHDDFSREAALYAESVASAPISVLQAYIDIANRLRSQPFYQEAKQIEIEKCAELWAQDDHHQSVARFLKK